MYSNLLKRRCQPHGSDQRPGGEGIRHITWPHAAPVIGRRKIFPCKRLIYSCNMGRPWKLIQKQQPYVDPFDGLAILGCHLRQSEDHVGLLAIKCPPSIVLRIGGHVETRKIISAYAMGQIPILNSEPESGPTQSTGT